MGDVSASDAPGTTETVPVRLRTSLRGCSIPYVPYMVPLSWQRSQLSTLVNKVLATANDDAEHRAVPFDFIANGELLRTSLGEYIARSGTSAETTLELEYVRSTLPPVHRDSAMHDDWVASADARRSGCVLTASFDGVVRNYKMQDGQIDTEPAVYEPVSNTGARPSLTCARWLTHGAADAQGAVVVGDMAGTVSVWQVPPHEPRSTPVLNALDATFHKAPVSNVDVRAAVAPGERAKVLSAGWDGAVACWSVPTQIDSAQSSGAKRRKHKQNDKGRADTDESSAEVLQPDVVVHHVNFSLGASTAQILGSVAAPGNNARTLAVFAPDDEACLWTAGWDGTVKTWDIHAGGISTGQKSSDAVHLSLDAFNGSTGAQVVTGHMDNGLALYDFRDQVTNAAVAIHNAHAAPIGALRTHPQSRHMFASGSYDGRIKVWDVRSPKHALFALTQPTSSTKDTSQRQTKLLALDWTPDGNTLLAGGEDCRISVYHGNDIGQ